MLDDPKDQGQNMASGYVTLRSRVLEEVQYVYQTMHPDVLSTMRTSASLYPSCVWIHKQKNSAVDLIIPGTTLNKGHLWKLHQDHSDWPEICSSWCFGMASGEKLAMPTQSCRWHTLNRHSVLTLPWEVSLRLLLSHRSQRLSGRHRLLRSGSRNFQEMCNIVYS